MRNTSSFVLFAVLLVLAFTSQQIRAAVTIPYGTRISNPTSSEDYIVEAGGCFHVFPVGVNPVETSYNRFYANNIQIAGKGYFIPSSSVQETSGAIRISVNGNNPALTTNTYFAGTITLAADAIIGIQQNTANKNAFFTSFAAQDAAYRLTLGPYENTDTLCVVGNNDTFANPISITGAGTVQAGKIAAESLTLYSHVNAADARTYTFDGTSGSLGTGTVTVGSGSTLKFQRSGSASIGNVLTGAGKAVFDGTAVYTFTSANALTGFTGNVVINPNASVKIYGENAQSSTSVAFTGTGTLIAGYNTRNDSIQNFSSLANVSGFTGTLLMADSYRWSLSPGTYNSGYKIGATHGGQIFLNSNGNYSMSLYIEGMGIQAHEAFGAIRMIGVADYRGAMTNLGGTVYLTGDARVSAANTPASGNGVSSTHNQGMISAQILSQNTENKASLRINGNAFNGTYTHMILTGTNDYGKTYIENRAILQVGYNGTVNGAAATAYDGTSGTLGTGDVVFCAVDGTSGTTSDLGGKLIFARSDAYEIQNSIVGKGAVEFTSGGKYTLAAAAGLQDFSGNITVNQNSALTLCGQTLAGSVLLDAGALLGTGTLSGTLTMNPGSAFASGISVSQNDLTLTGTYIADLDSAQPDGKSLTKVRGTLRLTNGSTLNLTSADFESLTPGVSFNLLEGGAGSFADLDLSTLTVNSGIGWDLSLRTAANGNLILNATASVPEPSAFTLLFTALALGSCFFRKRK